MEQSDLKNLRVLSKEQITVFVDNVQYINYLNEFINATLSQELLTMFMLSYNKKLCNLIRKYKYVINNGLSD